MCSLLAKRISSHFFSPSSLHCLQYHHVAVPTSLLQRYLSTQSQPHKELPFLAEYLISSFGFSTDRALKVSADSPLTTIKSSDQPDSVVQFLRDTGLSDAQIKAVVSFEPRLLASNVEKTLKPKVCELIDGGFSRELLVLLIQHSPGALLLKNTVSRLRFWRDFVGNSDQALLKIIPRNGLLVKYNIDKHIVPRLNLLNEYGLSNRDIVAMLGSGYGCCMTRSLDSVRQILELIEELGIPKESRMFLRAFRVVRGYSIDKIERKMEFFKMTYSWSQEEIYSAFKKFPDIIGISMDKIELNMNFLMSKAKLEPRSIASQPILLGFSLRKRLVPRHHVLSILASKGLMKRSGLLTACQCSEKRFFEKYVEPYKKDVPELAGPYLAAVGVNVSV